MSKNDFIGQKQAKWGQSKQLWHSNLQTFFDEVMIFELVGDVVKTFRKTFFGACTQQQKYWRFSPKTAQKWLFLGKIGPIETALAPKPANFF